MDGIDRPKDHHKVYRKSEIPAAAIDVILNITQKQFDFREGVNLKF